MRFLNLAGNSKQIQPERGHNHQAMEASRDSSNFNYLRGIMDVPPGPNGMYAGSIPAGDIVNVRNWI
jgi:hypothetical protein